MKLLHYSWKEYLLVIAVLLIVYYAYVLLRYYRKDIMKLVKGKQRNDAEQDETEILNPFAQYEPQPASDPIEDKNFELAGELIVRVKDLIADVSERELPARDVLQELKNLLMEYPTVKDDILRGGISTLILTETERYGSIQLDKRAVDELWRTAFS
jgi:hypothetical protein